MDSRERILAVLDGEIPDRVPYVEVGIGNPIIEQHYGVERTKLKSITTIKWLEKVPGWRLLAKRFVASDKTYVSAMVKEVEKYRKMQVDVLTVPICLFPNKNWATRKQRKFTMPHIDEYVDEYGRKHKLIPTNYGVDAAFYLDGALTSEELYDMWGPIDPHAPFRMKIYNAAVKASKQSDGSVSPFIIGGIGGINEVSWEALGMKFFAKCVRKKLPFLRRVLDDRKNWAIEMIKDLADNGAEAVMMYDDYGFKEGPLINPKHFKEEHVPRLKQIVDAAHKRSMKFLMHSCGNLNELWDDLMSVGIDALHPIESAARMDIFRLKRENPHLTFIGNVSPQDLQDKTPDVIREYTTRLMTECKAGGRYMLSSGHSIHPAIDLQNYLAMRETHDRLASYNGSE
jgi:uroporphyrinogen decarboxylase